MNALEPETLVDPQAAELLERIEAHGFNAPDDPLGFESRLADDQGWTLGYALAVAAEYRRFLVLTQVAGHAVSPSHDVDEAWHLHLTRTVHYEAFCGAVFGRFLHHEPAKAGEGARHREMYRETLADYRRVFGVEPPAPIWTLSGSPERSRNDADAGWVVPHALRAGRSLAVVVVLGAMAAGLLLRSIDVLDPLQQIGPFAFLAGALLVTAASGWLGLRAGMPSARSTVRDRLDPYEAAWLSGGAERMTMTAVAALAARGVLLAPGRAPEHGPRPPIAVDRTAEVRGVHPAEVHCLSAATDEGLRFGAACRAMQPLADQFERRLIAADLVSDACTLPSRRVGALAALALLLAVECERIVHAFGTHHRIGFLVLLTLLGMALVFPLARRARRPGPRAERALRPLRLSAGRYHGTPRVGDALAFGVALIGGTTLAGDLRFEGLGQQVNLDALGAAWAARQRLRRGAAGADDSTPTFATYNACGTSASDGGGGSGASSCGSGGGGSSCASSCGSGCGGGSSS